MRLSVGEYHADLEAERANEIVEQGLRLPVWDPDAAQIAECPVIAEMSVNPIDVSALVRPHGGGECGNMRYAVEVEKRTIVLGGRGGTTLIKPWSEAIFGQLRPLVASKDE
jgi:hypothetical protein